MAGISVEYDTAVALTVAHSHSSSIHFPHQVHDTSFCAITVLKDDIAQVELLIPIGGEVGIQHSVHALAVE